MEEKFTITIQVTAEQGEKIFKLLSGTKSRQAKYQDKKRATTVNNVIKTVNNDIKSVNNVDKVYTVWEVEPSLYPPGISDSRTLLINQLTKEQMIPAFQDMSGIDASDPANATLLANGNRFYPSRLGNFGTLVEAEAFAMRYAVNEGVDLTLPTRFEQYYKVKDL